MGYDAWKADDRNLERGDPESDPDEERELNPLPLYRLRVWRDRGLDLWVARLSMWTAAEGWRRLSDAIVHGDAAEAVRELREYRRAIRGAR